MARLLGMIIVSFVMLAWEHLDVWYNVNVSVIRGMVIMIIFIGVVVVEVVVEVGVIGIIIVLRQRIMDALIGAAVDTAIMVETTPQTTAMAATTITTTQLQ